MDAFRPRGWSSRAVGPSTTSVVDQVRLLMLAGSARPACAVGRKSTNMHSAVLLRHGIQQQSWIFLLPSLVSSLSHLRHTRALLTHQFRSKKSNMAWRTPISRVCDVYRTAAAGCRVRVTTRPYRTPKPAAGGGPAALAGAGGAFYPHHECAFNGHLKLAFNGHLKRNKPAIMLFKCRVENAD